MRLTVNVEWDNGSEVEVVEQGLELNEIGGDGPQQQSDLLHDTLTRAVGKVLKAHRPE